MVFLRNSIAALRSTAHLACTMFKVNMNIKNQLYVATRTLADFRVNIQQPQFRYIDVCAR